MISTLKKVETWLTVRLWWRTVARRGSLEVLTKAVLQSGGKTSREVAFRCGEVSREPEVKKFEAWRKRGCVTRRERKTARISLVKRTVHGHRVAVFLPGRRYGWALSWSQRGERQARKEKRTLRGEKNAFCAGEPWGVWKRERKKKVRRTGIERLEIEPLDVLNVENGKKLCRRWDAVNFVKAEAVECCSKQYCFEIFILFTKCERQWEDLVEVH